MRVFVMIMRVRHGFVLMGMWMTRLVLMLGFWQDTEGCGYQVFLLGPPVRVLGSVAVLKYMHLGTGDSAAVHFLKAQDRADVQRRSGFHQDFLGYAGINKRAEEHVPGDSGKAFEVSDSHQVSFSPVRYRAEAIAEAGSISFMEPER